MRFSVEEKNKAVVLGLNKLVDETRGGVDDFLY